MRFFALSALCDRVPSQPLNMAVVAGATLGVVCTLALVAAAAALLYVTLRSPSVPRVVAVVVSLALAAWSLEFAAWAWQSRFALPTAPACGPLGGGQLEYNSLLLRLWLSAGAALLVTTAALTIGMGLSAGWANRRARGVTEPAS